MNPLASGRGRPQADKGLEDHANIWAAVQQMPPDAMQKNIDAASYATPILGKLAFDPKVTRKDVIKAAADAAGTGKIPADEAVAVISQMPMDETKLQPWLKALYATHLTALVHMKAAAMPAPQQAAPAQAPAQMPSPLAAGVQQ